MTFYASLFAAGCGYVAGAIVEACIWRCGVHRIRWAATFLLTIGTCYGSFKANRHVFPTNNDIENDTSVSLIVFTLCFLSSWTFINTAVDLVGWILLCHLHGRSSRLPRRIAPNGGGRLDWRLVALLPVTSAFLSLLMVPGILLLCGASVFVPPIRVILARQGLLARSFPLWFASEVHVVPAIARHPIVWLVNTVMGAAVTDEDGDPSDGGALAFALFNLVFSATTIQRGREVCEVFVGDGSLLVHECCHVRQQMLSRSVLSFLAMYLAQYLRQTAKLNWDWSEGYQAIAAEHQAYTLEETPPLRAPAKEEDDYPVWRAIKRDFYATWYS